MICCSHKSFKRSIKSWSSAKKINRVTEFNQEAWLESYNAMNTKKEKITLKKTFTNLWIMQYMERLWKM